MPPHFRDALPLRLLRGRGKLPTVSSEGNIGEDQENHADESDPFL
jgi:hypothetical protein